VGGNPLLARVSAYYHDIGKLSKPEYFTENEPAFVNSGVIDVRSGGGLAADGDGVGVVVREAEGAIGTENAEDQEEEGKEEADSADDIADQAEHEVIVHMVFGFLLAGMGVVGVKYGLTPSGPAVSRLLPRAQLGR